MKLKDVLYTIKYTLKFPLIEDVLALMKSRGIKPASRREIISFIRHEYSDYEKIIENLRRQYGGIIDFKRYILKNRINGAIAAHYKYKYTLITAEDEDPYIQQKYPGYVKNKCPEKIAKNYKED